MLEQTKLTAKEVVIAMLKSFLAVVIVMWISCLLAEISYQLNSDVGNVVLTLLLLIGCFLYVNYLMFIKFDDRDENDRHISRIARIKKVFQSIQLRKVLGSKNTLFFLLTTICGIVATFVMTIGSVFSEVLIDKWLEFDAWAGLGVVGVTFVMSGVVSCVFAKWISLRTHNTGVKWASVLPIICMDGFVLFLPIYLIFAILFNDVLIPLFS